MGRVLVTGVAVAYQSPRGLKMCCFRTSWLHLYIPIIIIKLTKTTCRDHISSCIHLPFAPHPKALGPRHQRRAFPHAG